MSKKTLIFNTILNVVAIFPAFGVQLATVMGGATAAGEPGITGLLGTVIAASGYCFPAVFPVAIAGMWFAYIKKREVITKWFVWAPWIYLGVLMILTVLFFLSA